MHGAGVFQEETLERGKREKKTEERKREKGRQTEKECSLGSSKIAICSFEACRTCILWHICEVNKRKMLAKCIQIAEKYLFIQQSTMMIEKRIKSNDIKLQAILIQWRLFVIL